MKDLVPILLVLALVFIARSIRILQDSERFAEYVLGKFTGLIGPGLVIKSTLGSKHWVKLKLGDRGKTLGSGLARFHSVDVPIEGGGASLTGSAVRLSGFTANKAIVTLDNQPRTYKCVKCGHENVL